MYCAWCHSRRKKIGKFPKGQRYYRNVSFFQMVQNAIVCSVSKSIEMVIEVSFSSPFNLGCETFKGSKTFDGFLPQARDNQRNWSSQKMKLSANHVSQKYFSPDQRKRQKLSWSANARLKPFPLPVFAIYFPRIWTVTTGKKLTSLSPSLSHLPLPRFLVRGSLRPRSSSRSQNALSALRNRWPTETESKEK